MRIAVCSGSFDPITLGHMDIIRRTAACFDQVYVCVSPNAEKRGQMFTPEQKLKLVEAAVLELPNVTAVCWPISPRSGRLPPLSGASGPRAISTRNISRPW